MPLNYFQVNIAPERVAKPDICWELPTRPLTPSGSYGGKPCLQSLSQLGKVWLLPFACKLFPCAQPGSLLL